MRRAALFLLVLPIGAWCVLCIGRNGLAAWRDAPRAGEIETGSYGRLLLHTARGARVSAEARETIALDSIPLDLRLGALLQEDQAFYAHRGFSVRETWAALRSYAGSGQRLRGASTLTQQLARTLFLNNRRSLARKLLELRIAQRLERVYSKDELLALYLNRVYWGRGVTGVRAAAAHYFQKRPADLTREQAAFLVAILPNPHVCLRLAGCSNAAIRRRMLRIAAYLERRDAAPPRADWRTL